ncbi:FGFR1 oncogene partner 2 homolog isoform X3 [Penaeus japonicus]|uniref:FGFR1 oncogene partner 2 homolog isoform X3 n=1 Tax=Penaeus japonicus TaxID=27405 RepID=UPI001C7175A7|nr:FGFR1 oncogene partner 2 homolog isoform X3 [Penaeus japonicus]
MYDKMSVLQQVLTDARKLATRLRDHDSSADSLLSQAQGMFKQVESMKEYCEEMNELNEAANNRPRSALIHSIQQENRHIRQLQQENKELRLALEEHQNVMELIMSKYRQQVAKLVSVNKKQMQPNTQDQAKLAAQIERVSEMVAVMRKAASLGDDECQQQQRLISALATENKGLREMLSIANRSGSIPPASTAVDAETQTEYEVMKAEAEAEVELEEEEEEEEETPTQADSSNLNTTQIEQKSAETEGTSAS